VLRVEAVVERVREVPCRITTVSAFRNENRQSRITFFTFSSLSERYS
jgi:hypothetical protein